MWLSNILMVSKSNEKWHMCVDYINHNKDCLRIHTLYQVLMDWWMQLQVSSF